MYYFSTCYHQISKMSFLIAEIFGDRIRRAFLQAANDEEFVSFRQVQSLKGLVSVVGSVAQLDGKVNQLDGFSVFQVKSILKSCERFFSVLILGYFGNISLTLCTYMDTLYIYIIVRYCETFETLDFL